MRTTFETSATSHEHACRLLEAMCEGYVLAMLEEFDAHPEGEFPCCIKCGGFRTRNAPLTPAQAESIVETLEHGHPVSGLQRHHLAEILASHGFDRERNADLAVAEPTERATGPTYDPFDNPCGEDEDCPAQNYCAADGQCSPVLSGPYGRPDPPPSVMRPRGIFQTAQVAGSAAGRHGTVRIRSARQLVRNKGGHTVELACYQAAMKRRTGADPAAKVIICCVVPGTFRGVVLMSDQHQKPEKRGCIDDPVVDARPVGGCGCTVPAEGA